MLTLLLAPLVLVLLAMLLVQLAKYLVRRLVWRPVRLKIAVSTGAQST